MKQKENLTLHQVSIRALFHAPLQFIKFPSTKQLLCACVCFSLSIQSYIPYNSDNNLWAYICSKGCFAGLIFWGAYFRRGLLLEQILHFRMGGLIIVQKAVLLGLFSRELIFGGAYYWKEFCVSKWVGLDNNNSLKHYKNSLKQLALIVHGLIFRRAYYWKDFESEIWGTNFWEGLFLEGLIGISRYFIMHSPRGFLTIPERKNVAACYQ